jgi:hypothetical protein
LERRQKDSGWKDSFLAIDKEEMGISNSIFQGDPIIPEGIGKGIGPISLMVGYGLFSEL